LVAEGFGVREWPAVNRLRLPRLVRIALVVLLVVVAAGCAIRSHAAPNEGAPAYSRDGRWVAFTSDRGRGNDAIYVARVGGAASRITDSRDGDGHYAWSPDGSRLVFSRSTGKDFPDPASRGLFIVNRDGTGLRQLTAGDDFWACWAEGGRTIVFERAGGGEFGSGVYAVAAAGGPARRLAGRLAEAQTPACSPDGSTIAYGEGRIVLLDLASGRRRVLPTAPDSYDASAPSWSPDGTRLVFQAYRERADGDPKSYKFGVNTLWTLEELYVVRADGSGGVRRLTHNAAGDRFPSWLPDGRIFFSSNRDGVDGWDGVDQSDFYVMKSNGEGVRGFQWEPGAKAANGSHVYAS
jgi:TolB protein